MATRPLFTQDLPDLDTTFREHAREDSRLECLALYAGQTGEQGRRRGRSAGDEGWNGCVQTPNAIRGRGLHLVILPVGGGGGW